MEYETITVPEDTHRTIDISTDEMFKDVLIDITRRGASVTIETHGTGWWIRNVGIRGTQSADEPAMLLADNGERISRLLHVYLGDGADPQTSASAVELKHNHTGRLWAYDTTVRGWTDPGFDSSAPVGNGGGHVRYKSCYAANNHGANYLTGDDTLVDSLAIDHSGRGRALWALGDTSCQNCDLNTGGKSYAAHAGTSGRVGSVTLTDSRYDAGHRNSFRAKGDSSVELVNTTRGPNETPPASAPASAIDAATGPPADSADSGLTLSSISTQSSHWSTTERQTASSSTTFTDTISGLSPGTDYDFLAVAEASDGTEQTGSTTTFTTRSEGETEPVSYTISDVYISGINGPAIQISADNSGANIVVENAHIENCPTGILADGVTVTVRNSEISADEPLATANGGDITEENTNTGSSANPSMPSTVPGSPSEAAGSNIQ